MLKTIKSEIDRIRSGYEPKTDSFWIWLLYTIHNYASKGDPNTDSRVQKLKQAAHRIENVMYRV